MRRLQKTVSALSTLIFSQVLIGGLRPTAVAATYYVNAGGQSPTPPYATWSTAATNIQDAVGIAGSNDLVLVTNGLYQYGGAPANQGLSNRIYATNVMTIRSVNGPALTAIRGGPFARCAYLADGATLSGFTLTNGTGRVTAFGAGAYCAGASSVLTNCVITGNSALGPGGGVYSGKAFDCVISNNISYSEGGGAASTFLSNCIVAGNTGSVGYGAPGGGIYGGTAINCLVSNNIGPHGGGADSASLRNCRLLNNSALFGGAGNGGGARSCSLTNCLLMGNSAGGSGGGAANSTLVGCVIWRNYATNSDPGGGSGGGAAGATLVNCTVVSNSAGFGGGLDVGSAKNSILYYNTDGYYDVENYNANLTNCCTTPLPGSGVDNFTRPPLFRDLAGGDFHLQSISPCINAGNNSFLPSPLGVMAADLDGNPRITGQTVDAGAYEFQSPASMLSYAWAQSYGLPADGTADFSDPDGDGLNNWQEWMAGTNPTNGASALRMLAASNSVSGFTISWQSVNTRTYYVERATNLSSQPAFLPLSGYITGQSGITSYTDPAATNDAAFYRIGVQR